MTTILITGPIAVGKTTVATRLASRPRTELVRVRDALVSVLGLVDPDRRQLQEQGATLDRRTRGRWLVDYLLERGEVGADLVVDAVRTERQAIPILEVLPGSHLVYLDAAVATRRLRFLEAAKTDPIKLGTPFDRAMQHPTELTVGHLRRFAELVIETDDKSAVDTVRLIAERFLVVPR